MSLPCLPKRLDGFAVLTAACVVFGACGERHDASTHPDEHQPTSSGGSDGDSDIDVPLETGEAGDTVDGVGGTGVSTSVTANCARTEVTAVDTTTAQPADIIILVDSSPSMVEEIGFVRENLNAFSKQIIESGVDARVIMIAEPMSPEVAEDVVDEVNGICIDPPLGSGSCPDDSLLPNYVHIPQAIASTDSLDVIMRIRDQWIGYIRPEAIKALFIVSDDDAAYPRSIIYGDPPRWEDFDFMSNEFFNSFDRVDADLMHPWSFNGVYPFSECADSDGLSEVYARLVERTNGIAGDLCEQDFQPVFDGLAARVVQDAVALSCEWEIPASIDGQTFSTELVQVTRTSAGNVTQELSQVSSETDCVEGAWYFDDPMNPQRVLACPPTCDAISDDTEGKIDVVFGCEVVEGCSASGASSLATVGVQEDDEDAAHQEPVPCEWSMPKPKDEDSLVDLDTLNVRYVTHRGFGVLLGRVDAAEDCTTSEQGWYYDDQKHPTSILACENTCETLQDVDVKEIEALFGCETKPALIR